MNLFALPFLMPDYKAIDAVTKGAVGKQIFGILDKAGVVPLAWGENGFRELSNSRGPIASPADMKGKKFRAVGSPGKVVRQLSPDEIRGINSFADHYVQKFRRYRKDFRRDET